MTRVFLVPPRSDARARLLAAARRRFASDGALSATLDDVRRDAGVSVGALYHHFPDKAALASAVFAEVLGEYQDGFVAMLRRHDTAEGGIRGGVDFHLRWVSAHRAETGLLLGPRLDSDQLRESNERFFAAVTDWWRPHHRYGALQPLHVPITAALWLGPAQEYSRHWISSGARRLPPGTIDVFADAAWKALRANGTEEE
jgi:AcrR family transcriptional regulator